MTLSELDRRLLNDFQREFPLVERPYAEIAAQIGTTEADVLARLSRFTQDRVISRVGAILPPNTVGASLLVAMMVPPDQLDLVATEISGLVEVNHNYSREHVYNLWFVMTGDSAQALDRLLDLLEARFGFPILRLPLLEEFHIDLGFPIDFDDLMCDVV